MSEELTLPLDIDEATALYRVLLRLDDATEDDRLGRLRRRLEKSLFARLSIKEMELLLRSDQNNDSGR